MKAKTIIFILLILFLLPITVNGQTSEHFKLVDDGIVFEYEKPTESQIKEWAERYKDICFKKIRKEGFFIPKDMEKNHPCLVYLILQSKSMEIEKDQQSWFDLYPIMSQEKIYKLYDILYRERYKLALQNEIYNTKKKAIDYYYGTGGSRNYKKAFIWYNKTANLGDASAINTVGWMYYKGLGVKQDFSKAYEFFKKAMGKGDFYAIGNIGIMYYYGQYVNKDPQQAFNFLKKASDSDDPPSNAMRVLSACYRYGVGTSIDNEKAEYWLKKSAEKGDEQARKVLEIK